MSKLTIRTNNHWRSPVYGYELTDKERAEFDYIPAEELDSRDFLRYRGWVYDPSEFMRTPQNESARQELNELSNWHGYQSDSFFSGIVVRYSDDCEQYQIGTYYS